MSQNGCSFALENSGQAGKPVLLSRQTSVRDFPPYLPAWLPLEESGGAPPHSKTLTRHRQLTSSARFWTAPALWRFRSAHANDSPPFRPLRSKGPLDSQPSFTMLTLLKAGFSLCFTSNFIRIVVRPVDAHEAIRSHFCRLSFDVRRHLRFGSSHSRPAATCDRWQLVLQRS